MAQDLAEEQLGRAQRNIDTFVMRCPHGARDGAVETAFLLCAHSDLRDQCIAVDDVTEQSDLGAEYILIEHIALSNAERGTDILRVEILPCVAQFDPVGDSQRHPMRLIEEVRQKHCRHMSLNAHAACFLPSCDGRPVRNAALLPLLDYTELRGTWVSGELCASAAERVAA